MDSTKHKKKTIQGVVVEQLLRERRRVAADWRIFLLVKRATRDTPANERRWEKAWDELWRVKQWVQQRVERTTLGPLAECEDLFVLGEAVSSQLSGAPTAIEILMEANPTAALSHFSAMHFHGLTEEMPAPIHLATPYGRPGKIVPHGFSPEDIAEFGDGWIVCRRLESVFQHQVIWHRLRQNRMVGLKAYVRAGSHYMAMSPERVLLEGLMTPEDCGGLVSVFKAWANAVDTLDLEHLIECAEQIGSAVLRQRAGYLLERHGLRHKNLDRWADMAKPGGTSKLDPHAPFGGFLDFDERWKLAINTKVLLKGY